MRSFSRRKLILPALLALALVLPGAAVAQGDPGDSSNAPLGKESAGREEFVPGEVIVRYEDDAGIAARAGVRQEVGADKLADLDLIKAELVEVEGSADAAIRALERLPEVEYAERNRLVYANAYDDEPRFDELWGLHNTGQTIEGNPGTNNVDVNALEASAVEQGDPNLVIAVIDDGVDFSHPDLEDRAWENPGETPNNGIDDDNNGLVDDVNGYDFFNDDGTLHDVGVDAHGTHVSGTIAASVNNQGVVGVAPNVQIMGLKFLGGPDGSGSLADAILAIEYATDNGAKISNNSWGYLGPPDQSLKDAIEASDQLFIAAAGNESNNNDANSNNAGYPASYNSANILSVAAVDNDGNLASFSNFGANTVDISGPGVDILSSVPGIPALPAAVLSSVGSNAGKALVDGFGTEEVSGAADRASYIDQAFDAVDRGSQQVVLVVDDADDAGFGFPDVGPTVAAAIQTATGTAPQEIDVPYGSNGPDLSQSQFSGKTVVWATGKSFDSSTTETTLTTADQQSMTTFLNNGGKLAITGLDAMYLIENSTFVTNTLDLDVVSDVDPPPAFDGAAGTDFAGASYDLLDTDGGGGFYDRIAPATNSATTQGDYPGQPGSYEYYNGTSMATPHVTGVAALVASDDPSLLNDPVGLKQVLMDTGKPLSNTQGDTVTGDMVDADAALDGEIPTDTTPPTVEEVTPADGAKNVKGTANVTATFSEAMDPDTINENTFVLTRKGVEVDADVSYNAGNNKATLTLDPDSKLKGGYTATVTTGATDLAGNALEEDEEWSFKTKKKKKK
ncbi:MAG: S8 family serine peptidase [Rubrobacteraceae bacterium]